MTEPTLTYASPEPPRGTGVAKVALWLAIAGLLLFAGLFVMQIVVMTQLMASGAAASGRPLPAVIQWMVTLRLVGLAAIVLALAAVVCGIVALAVGVRPRTRAVVALVLAGVTLLAFLLLG